MSTAQATARSSSTHRPASVTPQRRELAWTNAWRASSSSGCDAGGHIGHGLIAVCMVSLAIRRRIPMRMKPRSVFRRLLLPLLIALGSSITTLHAADEPKQEDKDKKDATSPGQSPLHLSDEQQVTRGSAKI